MKQTSNSNGCERMDKNFKPLQTDMNIKAVHDESKANRVKHAVPCYHVGGTLLAVGTTSWYTHPRFGG